MTAAASVVLAGSRLDGLELLLAGLFGDVDGYRLPGEEHGGWELAPTLEVPVPVRPGERITLEDPDRTPLAVLTVEDVLVSQDGRWWVSGKPRALRHAEHGYAREFRPTRGTNLAGRAVALFSSPVRAPDVLRAVCSSSGGGIDLIFVGASDAVDTVQGMQDLRDSAAQLPDARVFFMPNADLGTDQDLAMLVLRRLGAEDPLDFRRESGKTAGAVLLFTGLSGAGKSTLARALVERLGMRPGRPAVLLDGDDVRREIAGELGFGRDDRDRNLQRIAWVAARIAQVGGVAVCAPIAPFASSRAAMRSKVEPDSPFIVIYVSTPLEMAESRDRKGLYAKARAGVIQDFTGIDSPYEEPTDADLVLDTSASTVDECVAAVVRVLIERAVIVEDARGSTEEPQG